MRWMPLALLFAVPAAAQVLVVDQLNGPGTHFTTIAAAVAAAPDGAVLRIRGGYYTESFAIVGKGLTLLGDGNVTIQVPQSAGAQLRIAQIAARQAVCLSNLTILQAAHTALPFTLACSDSPGLILIERVPAATPLLDLAVRNCDRFVARDCDFRNASSHANARVEHSNCVFENCQFAAGLGIGLVQTGGSVQLIDSAVDGGVTLFVPQPGIASDGGDLRITGQSRVASGIGAGSPFAIAGTSTVRLGNWVTLGGALDPGLTASVQPMPWVRTQLQAGGTQVLAELYLPFTHTGLLAIGFAGPTLPVAGIADRLWLDPSLLVPLAVGAGGMNGALAHTLPLPASPALLALRPCWQGLAVGPAGGLQLSNASLQLLR